jgi:hypothetical protein
MFMRLFFLLALCCGISPSLFATSLLWQTSTDVILRFDVDGQDLVFQVVGDKNRDKKLYHLKLNSRQLKNIKPGGKLRPFGPALANGKLVYGAGNFIKNVDLHLVDLNSGKKTVLQKNIPWIVEPTIAADGSIVTDLSESFDGLGLKIVRLNLGNEQIETLVQGPIQRQQDIPRDMHNMIKNEYPEVVRDLLVFQNDEYGMPNIYFKNLKTGEFRRLSPSGFHQERPHLSERYIAWEESERGFSVSNRSFIGVYELATGQVHKIDHEESFHYQVRVFDDKIIYGAKRPDAPNTPSIRVFSMSTQKEYKAQRCFPGPIYDWRAGDFGVIAAQRSGNGSRLLLASWKEILNDCL